MTPIDGKKLAITQGRGTLMVGGVAVSQHSTDWMSSTTWGGRGDKVGTHSRYTDHMTIAVR